MAIYHLSTKLVQRSKGHNVVAAAAYRHAAKMHAEREAHTFDFSKKQDVIFGDVLLPDNAPEWIKQLNQFPTLANEATNNSSLVSYNKEAVSHFSEKLWNEIENIEARKDAQLARDIEFSLPKELTPEQNITLAREFLKDQLCGRGMVADWSFHNDEGNPHVHVLVSLRALTSDGFGQKVRAWNSKELLKTLREQWAAYANFHLTLHQHDVKIDHRSYEEQGIDLIPTKKEGKTIRQMRERGIPTERMSEATAIKQENLERIVQNPQILIDKLARAKPTFTQEDIAHEMSRYASDKQVVNYKTSLNDKGLMAAVVLNNDLTLPSPQEINQTKDAYLSIDQLTALIKKIEKHDSVFSEKTLVHALSELTNNADLFAKALIEIKASPELIYLGAGDDGRNRYTTKSMFELENRLQTLADKWGEHSHLKLNAFTQNATLTHYESTTGKVLTLEQQRAVKHILSDSGISCLVGRAGTGKSFSLGAARAVWEAQGMRVLGIALSGKAADSLAQDAGIASRTIDSFRYAIEKGRLQLHANDVVVMDEAGMTDSVSMESILQSVVQAGAKLVLVGDHAQLQPVGAGSSFRALIERLGYAEIQTIYRQKVEWQREATAYFAAGQIAQGLALYHASEEDAIQFTDKPNDAMQSLVNDWASSVKQQENGLQQSMMMAYRNADVSELNRLARSIRLATGEISEGYRMKTAEGEIVLSAGDRIMLLKNNRALGLSNGRLATIISVDMTESGAVNKLTILPDGADKPVIINPHEYNDIAYGYAATVHKLQGATFDKSFAYVGGYGWDRHLTYVMMTRHRESVQLYADKETYADYDALTKALSKHGMKDGVMDFPLHFAERRGLENSILMRLLPEKLASRLTEKLDKLQIRYNQWLNPHGFVQAANKEAERLEKAVERQTQREDARLVAAYIDANREIGEGWQALQSTLNALGIDSLNFDKDEISLVKNTASWQQLETAKTKRNALAYQVMQDISRFELGLDVNSVDRIKLRDYAKQHENDQFILRYINEEKQGRVVHRDRLAADIQRDIKLYYPYLKKHNIDLKHLREQMRSHEKRQLFTSLSLEEKACFRLVADYHALSVETGKRFADYANAKDESPLFSQSKTQDKAMRTLSEERDRLAALILQNRYLADKALAFFEIGTTELAADSKFKTVTQAQKESAARWYRLQQGAARHEIRTRIANYHHALFVGDMAQRRKIALEITQDVKSHHGAILALHTGDELAVGEFWQAIRRDARYASYLSHVAGLSEDEKVAYHLALQYAEAKRAHGLAWREILSEKEAQKIDNETLYQKLAPHTKRYTAVRNALAAQITEDASPQAYLRHKSALAYFEIDINTLTVQADVHHRSATAQAYLDAYTTPQSSFLTRGEIASHLIASPKAYHGVVMEEGLTWKAIYADSRVYERHKAMQFLTPDEKKLSRTARRYRELNQVIGKRYARLNILQENTKKSISAQDKATLTALFAKRDYLADKIVNLTSIIHPTLPLSAFESNLRIKSDAIAKQSKQHQEKLGFVNTYQAAHRDVMNAVSVLYAALDLPEGTSKQTALLEALKPVQDALAYAATLKKMNWRENEHTLHYTLSNKGLPASNWNKQQQRLDKINEILFDISERYNLNGLNQRTALPDKALALIQANEAKHPVKSRIDYERIRELLNQQPEQIAAIYLGEPTSRNGREWRYGSRGKIVVCLTGSHTGKWYNHKEGVGGDMLKLISHVTGITDSKSLVEEASRFLGGYVPQKTHIDFSSKKQERKHGELTQGQNAELQQRLSAVNKIVKATVPIHGTLAERYLREHRHIHGELNTDNLRFHPALKNWMTHTVHPALVATAKNAQGEIVGLQATFLNPQTAKKADLKKHTKLSRGLTSEGALIHAGKADGVVAYAEGLETALSVAEANPDWNVHLTFGVANFAKVPFKAKAQAVVLCADNDGLDSGTAKTVAKSAQKLAAKGKDVYVALPPKPDDIDKYDFNDLLKNEGKNTVKDALDNRTLYKAAVTAESLKSALSETLEVAYPITSKIESAQLRQNNNMVFHDQTKAILTNYAVMEAKQSTLVRIMHSHIEENDVYKKASQEAVAHSKEIDVFVLTSIENVSIAHALQNRLHLHAPSIAEAGGFALLSERLTTDSMTEKDWATLLSEMSKKASRAKSQSHSRDRGGRSH